MTSPLRLFVSKADLLNVNKRTGPTFGMKAAGLTNSQQGKKKTPLRCPCLAHCTLQHWHPLML